MNVHVPQPRNEVQPRTIDRRRGRCLRNAACRCNRADAAAVDNHRLVRVDSTVTNVYDVDVNEGVGIRGVRFLRAERDSKGAKNHDAQERDWSRATGGCHERGFYLLYLDLPSLPAQDQGKPAGSTFCLPRRQWLRQSNLT